MKRIFDLAVSLSLLFILSPVFLVLFHLIRKKMGTPVLFSQERPGLHGKPFVIHKFRTMTNQTDENGMLFSDEERTTPFGNFLRKYSLDELPQLWNVLRGELSLVGPRPLLMEYLPLYNARQARRHAVKPGITGWAQVHGRNSISWEEKFELDVWYVDNASFALDLKILWLTVCKVFRQEETAREGALVVKDFTGSMQVEDRNKTIG